MKKTFLAALATGLLVVGMGSTAQAIPIAGDGIFGDFTGSFEYSAITPTTATLVVELTNTSPSANGGYLAATPALNRSSFQFRHNRHLLASFSLANG